MFIPNVADLSYNLRMLVKSKQWKWTEKEENSLQQIKAALHKHIELSYFDINKQSKLYVDASPVGLGAILVQ